MSNLSLARKAEVLLEALPYIKRFNGKTVLIKYGGKAMTENRLKSLFALNVVLLKYVGINPIIVHGGGPQINATLEAMGITPKFVNGLRVTDAETMKVVEMVLSAEVNNEIVTLLNMHGGKAVGLNGKDAGLLKAVPLQTTSDGQTIDLGHVGEVAEVSPLILNTLIEKGFIPVIAPIATDGTKTYNINADRVACAVAAAIKAEKMVLLTDINGVEDENGVLLHTLNENRVHQLLDNGTIYGGMREKVTACLKAIKDGVGKVHIIDGRTENAILLEIFTDAGIGTEIIHNKLESTVE